MKTVKTTLMDMAVELVKIRNRQVELYARCDHPDVRRSLGKLVTHTQNAINRAAMLSGLERGAKRLPLKGVFR